MLIVDAMNMSKSLPESGRNKASGKWPRSVADQLARPFWSAAGACPGLGPWLLNKRMGIWEQNRSTIPAALATGVLGDRLLINVAPVSLQERLAAVGYTADRIATHDFHSQFVFHGDCKHLLAPISQSLLDDEINQLFANQMIWAETSAYHRLYQRLREQGAFRHNNVSMESLRDIDRYFERYVRLAESISQYGYKSRNELQQSHGKGMKRLWWLEVGEQEVGIAIGPAGEVWRFGGGYHRTAIARNLGLESMPVQIRLVHGEWLYRGMNREMSVYERLLSRLQAMGA